MTLKYDFCFVMSVTLKRKFLFSPDSKKFLDTLEYTENMWKNKMNMVRINLARKF